MFQRSPQVRPGLLITNSNLSSLYSKTGRYEESAKFARRAIKYFKESPIPWNTLGLYYARSGDTKTALEYFLASYSYNNTYLVAAYNAACIYAVLGELEKALDYLKIAFEERRLANGAGTDPDLHRIRSRLEFQELLAAAKVKSTGANA